jgi:hypothetical protein
VLPSIGEIILSSLPVLPLWNRSWRLDPAQGPAGLSRSPRQGIDENVKTVTGFSSFRRIHPELDAQIPQAQQDTDESKANELACKMHLQHPWQPALIFLCLHLLS